MKNLIGKAYAKDGIIVILKDIIREGDQFAFDVIFCMGNKTNSVSYYDENYTKAEEHYREWELYLQDLELYVEVDIKFNNARKEPSREEQEECMTDPSQDDTVASNKIKASYEFVSGLTTPITVSSNSEKYLTDLKIGNPYAQIKKTDLVELNIALTKFCVSAEEMKNAIHELIVN